MDKQTGLNILGLAPSATLTDARTAFRGLAKIWHPDRFANDPVKTKTAEEKMKQVNAAFYFLLPLLPDTLVEEDVGQSPSDLTHGCASTHGKSFGFQRFFSALAAVLKKNRKEREKTHTQEADRFGRTPTIQTDCRAKTAVRTRKTVFETMFQNAVNHNPAGIQPRFHPKPSPSGGYVNYRKYFDPVTGRPRNVGHMKNRGVGPVEKISPISPVSPVKRH
ncbi:DnaJ domain-containing protein [uncultured Desulfobacter sp.]|uniref:J domain-containing protein n=1 Tax=uncultured Desulfobacter sp. TaxID=240139 RepID=UPI0029F48634|nr:DnaJ domain-containing protein [uncultured Desulfobacter sp.]